jgi:type I restriction enzyme M protein
MKQLQAEMRELLQQEEESKRQLEELFKSLGYGLE